MITPDFLRQRVPATESIAVVDVRPPWRTPCGHPSDVQICSRQICLVEEARARWRKKDKQGRIKRSLLWLDDEHIIITQ